MKFILLTVYKGEALTKNQGISDRLINSIYISYTFATGRLQKHINFTDAEKTPNIFSDWRGLFSMNFFFLILAYFLF